MAINYEAHLRALLDKKGLEVATKRQGVDEVLSTIAIMLKEKDPRFLCSIAGELSVAFSNDARPEDIITPIVLSSGEEKGIQSISFKDALSRIYTDSIHKIARSDNSSQKLYKNSRILYLDKSALDNYLGKNTSTELVVNFDLPRVLQRRNML